MENNLPKLPPDGRILFFSRDRDEFGFLSNFHEAPISIDGEVWRSTEYYYQAQKSTNGEYQESIRTAPSPGRAKALGSDPRSSPKASKQSWFAHRLEAMRQDWNVAKFSIMERAVRAKFSQNPSLKALLLATAEAEIVEDSAYDAIWGIGADGTGENRLGKLLMQIREELRNPTASLPVCEQ